MFVPTILGLEESEFGAVERKSWQKWIE